MHSWLHAEAFSWKVSTVNRLLAKSISSADVSTGADHGNEAMPSLLASWGNSLLYLLPAVQAVECVHYWWQE